jgi:hypothetical protein
MTKVPVFFSARRSRVTGLSPPYRQIEQLMVVDEAAIIPLTWASVNSLSKPNVERTFVPSGVEAFWKWDIVGS